MKKLLAFMLLFLTACAAAPDGGVVYMPSSHAKREQELWRILRFKKAGARRLVAEDDWYFYSADFKYAPAYDEVEMVNRSTGMCPVDEIYYTVYDKDAKKTVRKETLRQKDCGACHREH